GFFIFIPREYRQKKRGYSINRLINGYWPYTLFAILIYGLVEVQSPIQHELNWFVTYNFTPYIYGIEDSLVAIFQSFVNTYLTYFMSFVYLIIFSFIICFNFIVLAYTDNMEAFEQFTIAFVINYLVAFPFYVFVPIKATGYAIPNMEPLLYNLHPIIYQGCTIADPLLDNSFPSLHTSLSVTSMLIIYSTNLKRYKIFTAISTPLILFSIFYLGIHWILDAVAGIILAIGSYYIATHYDEKILSNVMRAAVKVEKVLGMKYEIVCRNCNSIVMMIPHIESTNCQKCGNIVLNSYYNRNKR
ncbi:MAG: phosphatase PAP2 family protein, partial [Methanosarcinales archaeon]